MWYKYRVAQGLINYDHEMKELQKLSLKLPIFKKDLLQDIISKFCTKMLVVLLSFAPHHFVQPLF